MKILIIKISKQLEFLKNIDLLVIGKRHTINLYQQFPP